MLEKAPRLWEGKRDTIFVSRCLEVSYNMPHQLACMLSLASLNYLSPYLYFAFKYFPKIVIALGIKCVFVEVLGIWVTICFCKYFAHPWTKCRANLRLVPDTKTDRRARHEAVFLTTRIPSSGQPYNKIYLVSDLMR